MVDPSQLDRLRGTRLVRRADVAALLASYEESLHRLEVVEEELAAANAVLASIADALGMPGAAPSTVRDVVMACVAIPAP